MALLRLQDGIFSAEEAPVPYAQLFIYWQDTDRLSPIYSDANLTLTHPNPLTADAEGRFPQPYLLAGEYRICVTTRSGTLLYDENGVPVREMTDQGISGFFGTTEELLADSALRYSSRYGGAEIAAGERVFVADGGSAYLIAPEDATDHHLMTDGGLKLYLSHAPWDWRGMRALGAALDGETDDELPLERHLALSAERLERQARLGGAVPMRSGYSLDAVIADSDDPNQFLVWQSGTTDTRIADCRLDSANGIALHINNPDVTDTRVTTSEINTRSYGVLINHNADGGRTFQSIGNRIVATEGDAHEWNLPGADFRYILSAADVVEGGLSGASSSSGFSWGIANARFWTITGGISKGARNEALHVEDGQRGGAAAGLSLDGCQGDAIRQIGPRGLVLSAVSGSFTAGETVTGGTSGETAVIHQVLGNVLDLGTATGTFTVGESVSGGTSGATATVDTANQPFADGVAVSAVNATHTGPKTGFSGFRAHYQPQYPALRGSSLSGAFFRGFEDGVTVSEGGSLMADNVATAEVDHVLNLGKAARHYGTVQATDKVAALVRGSSRSLGGFVIADAQPDTVIDYVGVGTEAGCTLEGFAFPVPVAHTGGGTQAFAIADLPDRALGQVTAFLNASAATAWCSAMLEWDGSALTVSNLQRKHYGALSDATFTAANGKLNLSFYCVNPLTTTAQVLFRGAWYAVS